MSWLTNWWYGGQQPSATTSPMAPSSAPLDPLETMEALHAKRLHLLKKSSDLLKEAKEHKAKGDSARALGCMKRKQQVDLMAKQMEGQLLNLEKTSMILDSAASSVDLAKAMRSGADQIKALVKEVDLDDLDQVVDDLDDGMRDVQELSNALSRPLGSSMAEEEERDESILAEMAGWDEEAQFLEAEKVAAKLPSVSTAGAVDTRGNGGGGNNGGTKQKISSGLNNPQ